MFLGVKVSSLRLIAIVSGGYMRCTCREGVKKVSRRCQGGVKEVSSLGVKEVSSLGVLV